MPETDLYKILDVKRDATPEEIRKAHKRLSRKYHPDVDKSAEDKFKQVQHAYDVLSDADKRKQYDQFGQVFPEGRGPGGPGGQPFNWGGAGGAVDLGDLFGGQVDLGDLFGAMGGGGRGGRGRTRRAQRGADLETPVDIPFRTAVLGGKHDLRVRGETLSVTIPPSVDTGTTIRVAGQGEPGQGGAPGDLLLKISVIPDSLFRREGNNLLMDLPLTITEATLGAKVDVPTLEEGQFTMTVPAGTSSGAKLRLRGKGVIDRQTQQRGDQLVVVKIVVPQKPSAKVKELLQELATAAPQNPRENLW